MADPKTYLFNYQVNNGTTGYMAFAIHDPEEWANPNVMTAPSTRDQVSTALQSWGPHIVEHVGLLPEKLDMYGVFDMADNPAPTYAAGRVCIAGDAAHASSPFHGAGAGMGIEDALVLVELLADVRDWTAVTKRPSLTAALQAFSAVRMERTQWLVQSSRDMGNVYQWRYPDTGRDSGKIKAEFERRARKIWDFDVDGMVADAKRKYEERRAGWLEG
jgi:salicylate hydroxylase